jgi:hypothetical protein
MDALYFTIHNQLEVKVIPDTQVYQDGHPILTYTYRVYSGESYYGVITFEKPGTFFTYTADGDKELSSDDVIQLVEKISHIRDNPNLWKLN